MGVFRSIQPNWKGSKHVRCGHIPDRVDIYERPAVVKEEGCLGDWEADTIIGKGSCLVG